jgi:class 3 adenylate cyclase
MQGANSPTDRSVTSSTSTRPARSLKILDLSAADNCLLVAFIVTACVGAYTLAEYYLRAHPGIAPYLDQRFLVYSLRVHLVELVWWPAIGLWALLYRRRFPSSRFLVHVTIQSFIVTIAIFSYLLGHLTSFFGGIALVGGVAVGFVMFDDRAVFAAIVSYLSCMLVLTMAQQAGLIPYAPLLASAPYGGGALSGWWLVSISAPTFGIYLLFLAWIYYLVTSWREREERLARTSEQLARANDIISRYIASQLTEQILLGNYDALDRHDRRRLTIFFSDIEEFSDTADHEEPEDLSEVLNEYLSEMADIAKRYKGTIDKFVGDAIMIFFGAPVATNDRDQALRAVRMAVEMQQRLVDLRRKWEQDGFERPFHVRIGINTGRASIGNFGSRERADYTAIGRHVNLAARLQAQCERDKILISHSTWTLVQEEVECLPKGEITVKGLRDPVMVYEVGAVRSPAANPVS